MSDLLEAFEKSDDPLPLDPFGAHPHWASHIAGLGGTAAPDDPSYIFATLYCRPAIGTVTVTVRFHDLAGTCGTLLFEIKVRSVIPGSEPSRLDTVVVDIEELIAAHGIVELSFESFRNANYAIACSINDKTDLAASHISVTVDRRATEEQHGRNWDWSGNVIAATRRTDIAPALIGKSLTDLERPQLETPMSQPGVPAQCLEEVFGRAMHALGRNSVPSAENWSMAYILQAINRFGSEQDRSRMLAYGTGEGALLSHFASLGNEVVAMRHRAAMDEGSDPGRELNRLWVPALCSEADFFENTHLVAGDIRHPVQAFRDQFDVIWTVGANREMTPDEFVNFVVGGLIHVKPGGLAIHVFDYIDEPGEPRRTDEQAAHALFRYDVERIAVLALSHHNEVVRLRFRHGLPPFGSGVVMPFGLIILRGGVVDD